MASLKHETRLRASDLHVTLTVTQMPSFKLKIWALRAFVTLGFWLHVIDGVEIEATL